MMKWRGGTFIAVLGLLAACAPVGTDSRLSTITCGGSLAHYHSRAAQLSFDYPSCWRPQGWQGDEEMSGFRALISYFSPLKFNEPCSGASVNGCGAPIPGLPPSSVLLRLDVAGKFGARYADMSGTPRTFGGHPARVTKAVEGCESYGGDVGLQASVFRRVSDSRWYEFDLCGKGPGAREIEQEFDALLRSVKISA